MHHEYKYIVGESKIEKEGRETSIILWLWREGFELIRKKKEGYNRIIPITPTTTDGAHIRDKSQGSSVCEFQKKEKAQSL